MDIGQLGILPVYTMRDRNYCDVLLTQKDRAIAAFTINRFKALNDDARFFY